MLAMLRASLLLGLLTAGFLMVYRDRPVVSAPVATATNDRKAAPDFTLSDARGAAVRLSDYKGKVVVLNFWATWCGPCKVEIPWFIEFENTYKDRGVAVLGVSMDDDGWKAVKPYIEQKKMNYRVVIGDDALAQQYGGVDSLPTTFLIDHDGKIARSYMGLVAKSTYKKEIEELLGPVK
jgi:peroxiredoxin